MLDRSTARTIRRLTAAEGYLELDMPDYALEELAGIGDAGAYSGVADWLAGEALREKKQYDAAIESLKRAVRDIPVPHNRAAVEALTVCLRNTGQDDMAEVMQMYATATQDSSSDPAPPTPMFDVEMNSENAGRLPGRDGTRPSFDPEERDGES